MKHTLAIAILLPGLAFMMPAHAAVLWLMPAPPICNPVGCINGTVAPVAVNTRP